MRAVNVRPVSGDGKVTGTVAVAPSRLASSAIGGRSTVTGEPPSALTSSWVGTEKRPSATTWRFRWSMVTGEGAVTEMVWPTTSSIGVTHRVVGSPSTAAAARDPGLPSRRPEDVAVTGPVEPSAASTTSSVARASSRTVPVSV